MPAEPTPSQEKGRPLYKHAPRWDDIRIIPGALSKGAVNDPTETTWQPGGTGTAYWAYAFDQSDELFFTTQMPHGYVIGSNINAHVHWTPHDRGAAETTHTVEWKIDYSVANIGDGMLPSTEVDLTDACQSSDHDHLKTPQGDVDMSLITNVSAIIVGRLFRDTGDTWTGTGVNAPILLELDFHYQTDDIGSVFATNKKYVK